MSKRVYCLYRVSTLGQVEKDDIPMQKQVCREFAAEKGWEIVREFSEKGISGFKVSAHDRDAVQEIQKDALENKFDVLLVFMFDRLGRKEDETPFVVEWFANNGIEVWSVQEGQQRFDTHVDKLMNYIRFWQASGESVKTSIRVKTRMGQLVQEGRFRGGCAPYGYKLVQSGRTGKKGRILYDIVINPDEVHTVRAIFDLADNYNYGGRKIATELAMQGIINERTNEPFHYSTIQNMLRNIMYTGILRSGNSVSDVIPELQIIEPEQFQRIKCRREMRSADYNELCESSWHTEKNLDGSFKYGKGHTPVISPKRNVGRTLLSGNVYCGHCGGRIFTSSTRRDTHLNGSVTKSERVGVYKCYNRTQHKAACDGQSTYRSAKVDAVIDRLLYCIFERAKSVNLQEFVKSQVTASTDHYLQQLKKAKTDYSKNQTELSKWENLMMDSLDGACVFTPEQIKKRMDNIQKCMDELLGNIATLQSKAVEAKHLTQEFLDEHNRLLSWAELYENASLTDKRMIASKIIKAVRISRGYEIEIEFSISEAQYLSGLEMA